jgi:predicted alpha/beta hydrolase family esterase
MESRTYRAAHSFPNRARSAERRIRAAAAPYAGPAYRVPMQCRVLVVPGLRGSGPRHWQTLWIAGNAAYRRVLPVGLEAPRAEVWAAAIDRALAVEPSRPLLVAHGFGCLAALVRLAQRRDDVAGVLLVAPRDPDEFGLERALPQALGMPSTLVASRNDPWLAFAAARGLAARLGSDFVDAGDAGHIDAESGYGAWPAGLRLVASLAARARAAERELRVALALVQ